MRIRRTSPRAGLLLALALAVGLLPGPVGADDSQISDNLPDTGFVEETADHAHTVAEEMYALDASSSAPGATFFNESSGCGVSNGAMTPATTTNSSSNRSIPSNHQVRGPWADFFGRDYSDVGGSMVW